MWRNWKIQTKLLFRQFLQCGLHTDPFLHFSCSAQSISSQYSKLWKNCFLHTTYSRQKFSGLSWMVKRYYIQDYPEYFGCVLTGLRIASKIMPRTFWSTTQSKNARSTEGTQKERENRAQMQSWKQIQF